MSASAAADGSKTGQATPEGAVTLTRISAEADLEALAPEWRVLFEDVPAATPFQSPDWLLPWWRSFRPGEPAILTARIGGKLAAIAPLYLERTGSGARLLPLGISLSDYSDILVAPGAERAVLPALAGGVARLSPDVWRLDLGDLPGTATALSLPAPEGWRREDGPHEVCPVLDVVDWCASVPALRRRKLRMAQHRARRAGEVVFSSVSAAEAGRFLDALVALHAARWETKGGEGVLADARVVAFHRAALPRLIAGGLADCRILTIGGRLAGAYYGLRRGSHAYAYLSGFDPAFTREAPGTLLVGDAVERACVAGLHVFHFLRGREAYKYDWGATDSVTWRLSLVRESPRG
jgi:CelD/BcsL family acetyltransferase involved in cellulose biosynthesis